MKTTRWTRLLPVLLALMFCAESAARGVKFIERHCRWPEGPPDVAKQLIRLEPWAKKVVEDIFGTLRDDGSGLRQYRKGGVFVPRKNAKSAGLATPIGLKLLFADGEEGAQIYSCAKDREQASITFNMAARMVELDPALRRRAKIIRSRRTIAFPRLNSFWRALPRDGLAAQGYNPHGVIFDELHTQPDEKMYEAMDLGSGTRSQPLFFWTSTAGEDPADLCKKEVDYARQIQEGILEDPTYYSFLRYLLPGEDWKSEDVWRRINPASFRNFEDLRAKFRRALVEKRKEIAFRMYYLNEFVEDDVAGWLNKETWDASAGEVNESELYGKRCWAGLDMASTTDLAAYALAFPMPGGIVKLLFRVFCPREGLLARSERDKSNYHLWAEQGLLTLIEGNAIDDEVIEAILVKDAERFEIKEVAFDPHQALSLSTRLAKKGFSVVSHRQGALSMSPPMKECEKLLLSKRLHHGNNKLVNWMFRNTGVKESKEGELIKPVKRRKHARIDAIVSMIMGTGRAVPGDIQGESIYATQKMARTG